MEEMEASTLAAGPTSSGVQSATAGDSGGETAGTVTSATPTPTAAREAPEVRLDFANYCRRDLDEELKEGDRDAENPETAGLLGGQKHGKAKMGFSVFGFFKFVSDCLASRGGGAPSQLASTEPPNQPSHERTDVSRSTKKSQKTRVQIRIPRGVRGRVSPETVDTLDSDILRKAHFLYQADNYRFCFLSRMCSSRSVRWFQCFHLCPPSRLTKVCIFSHNFQELKGKCSKA